MTDAELGPATRYWPVNRAPAIVNRVLRRLWIEWYVLRGHVRLWMCRHFGHALAPISYGPILANFYGVITDQRCTRCGWEAAIDRWMQENATKDKSE